MKIEGATIYASRSSLLEIEAKDSIVNCIIKVSDSVLGVKHLIRIKSGAEFRGNHVLSTVPEPILSDELSVACDNIFVSGWYIET